MVTKKKVEKIILLCGLALILLSLIIGFRNFEEIKTHPVLLQARITGGFDGHPRVYTLDYEYCFHNKKYSDKADVSRSMYYRYNGGPGTAWIVISAISPKLNIMMKDNDMFADFRVNIKDTANVKMDESCF